MNDDLLKENPTWIHAPYEMREAFQIAMTGKQYGAEETLHAFGWFNSGWRADKTRNRAKYAVGNKNVRTAE